MWTRTRRLEIRTEQYSFKTHQHGFRPASILYGGMRCHFTAESRGSVILLHVFYRRIQRDACAGGCTCCHDGGGGLHRRNWYGGWYLKRAAAAACIGGASWVHRRWVVDMTITASKRPPSPTHLFSAVSPDRHLLENSTPCLLEDLGGVPVLVVCRPPTPWWQKGSRCPCSC